MSRGGNYGGQKRQRETEKARKKQEKLQRRIEKRERGPEEIPVVSAAELMADLPSSADALRAMEERASGGRSAAPLPARLFVGSLAHATTAESLRAHFAKEAEVADAFVVTDRETGTSRGFGFVTLANRKDAARVIEVMHGSELDGRSIVVNVATERAR